MFHHIIFLAFNKPAYHKDLIGKKENKERPEREKKAVIFRLSDKTGRLFNTKLSNQEITMKSQKNGGII